jgi:predicted DNA-binding transcriptional regulator AlpA
MQSTWIDGTDGAEQFLPARQVWKRYGVTSMTLWRWLKNTDLKFPQPMHIGRLRYWRVSDLVEWERSAPRARGR